MGGLPGLHGVQEDRIDRIAISVGAAVFLCHLVANPHYGFFRDELYFIVCGRHPDFGYVDQPPIVPLLAAGSQIFGTSLIALRAVSASLAGLTAFVACVLAGEMGGGRLARALAGVSASLAPVLLAFGTMVGPDSVQMALWPLAVLFVGRALTRAPAWWLAAGATVGIAGEAKYSAIIAAVALLAGLAISGQHRAFASRWFWGGMGLAGAILLPNALWQWAHGLPMLELLHNGQAGKNVIVPPFSFLTQQLVLTNPALAAIWVAGVGWCLWRKRWRWLGVGTLILFAIMIGLHGKVYYPAPIYAALFAAGGVAIERAVGVRPAIRAAVMAAVIVLAIPLVPLAVPVLPEGTMVSYRMVLARLGIAVPAMEHHKAAALGQDFADMHGWPELAETVMHARDGLPPALREKVWVFTGNYGEAAAIDVFGHGLNPTLSGHNQYWLWGPRGFDGTALLDVGGNVAELRTQCTSAQVVATFSAPLTMPYEDGVPIVLCEGLHTRVSTAWARAKHFE